MGRGRRKQAKIRYVLQGRKLKAKKKIRVLEDGMFTYMGKVYLIDEFNPGTVNVDKEINHVNPYCREEDLSDYTPSAPPKVSKRGRKKNKYIAVLFSNFEECPDVQETANCQA